LGEALKQAYDAAPVGSPVLLTVDANGDRILLDGVRVKGWPAAGASGLVSVQVLDHVPDVVVGHRVFTVPEEGGEVLLGTGLPELPPPDPRLARKKGVPWLVVGASVFGVGGATAVYSLTQRAAAGTAPTIPEADAAHERQVISRWSAVGIAGAGVLLSAVGTLVIVF
jgi:hypothetical protein